MKLFKDMFDPLFKKGLPFFWEGKVTMLTQKEYQDKLIQCRLDHANFADMNQSLSGKTIVDKLDDDFEKFFLSKKHVLIYAIIPTQTI